MPDKLRSSDLKEFNAGDMTAQDFEAGDFGSIDVGQGEFQEGDYVNIMAQGVVGPDGLSIKHLAILGSDTPGAQEQPGDQYQGSQDPAAQKMMDQITGGGQ